jgi:hypothetical protein
LSSTRDRTSGPAAPPLLTPTARSSISDDASLPVHVDDDLEQAPPSFHSLYSTPESVESARAAATSKAHSSCSTLPRFPPLPPSVVDDSEDEDDNTEDEDSILPSFSSVVSGPQPSWPAAAARAVADTKAALPRDFKDAASASRDLDDGEPPPPYSEGSSPIKSFTYVMATAGGPASIITQVSQSAGVPPVSVLGGMYSNCLNLDDTKLIIHAQADQMRI